MLQQDLFKMSRILLYFYTLSLQFHKKKQRNKGRVCNFSQCECFYCITTQNITRQKKMDTMTKKKNNNNIVNIM